MTLKNLKNIRTNKSIQKEKEYVKRKLEQIIAPLQSLQNLEEERYIIGYAYTPCKETLRYQLILTRNGLEEEHIKTTSKKASFSYQRTNKITISIIKQQGLSEIMQKYNITKQDVDSLLYQLEN